MDTLPDAVRRLPRPPAVDAERAAGRTRIRAPQRDRRAEGLAGRPPDHPSAAAPAEGHGGVGDHQSSMGETLR
jgi:hypothetical protein